MRISDWSSDVCSSDLLFGQGGSLATNKLIMLPRGHLKSHMVATWAAWIITKHPDVTILYVSATAELAETQLYAIKNILGSSVYRRYFPEYIHPQEGKRERWSSNKLSVDHPKRRKEGISEDRKSTRLNSSHNCATRMPSSA